MRRAFVVFAGAILAVALDVVPLFAQDDGAAAPAAPAAAPNAAPAPAAPAAAPAPGEAAPEAQVQPQAGFKRGPGWYLSLWKLGFAWLLFLAWVKTTDWVNQDAQIKRQNYSLWNLIVFFPFLVAFLLLLVIPFYWIGFPLALIAWVAPLISYVVVRNRAMPHPDDKVLTPLHLRRWFAVQANKVGIKIAVEAPLPHELGPEVTLVSRGGANDQANQANLIMARQSQGFPVARQLFYDANLNRADGIMLDFSAMSVAVRYQVDGVWHDHAPMERTDGDLTLEVLKTLAALNPGERRAKQVGSVGVEIAKAKFDCKIVAQGTQGGERVLLHLSPVKLQFHTLDDLGMRGKMQEQFEELVGGAGFVVLSALPGGGMTTMVDGVVESMDRFTRNFVTVEDANKRERDIENVQATTYNSTAGETPDTVLPALIRTYPDVILVRDPVNAETLSILCRQVPENRLVVTSIRARDAVEALLRILQFRIPPAEFAGAVTAVLNQRLVRKLCEKCKEAYKPAADLLKQLGLPAGRVEAFYRTPTGPVDPKHPDKVCEDCLGIGYRGRTAIFELLVVENGVRQVLATTPRLDALRQAARQAKHRGLQEEGILLVARGVTSLQEVQRVLKQ